MTGLKREKNMWLLFLATALLSGLFGFAYFSEFVAVNIFKQTSGYPFGSEGPTPWYYKSAQLYSATNLIFGMLFLLAFSIGVWAFLKPSKKFLLISFGVSFLLFMLGLLTG